MEKLLHNLGLRSRRALRVGFVALMCSVFLYSSIGVASAQAGGAGSASQLLVLETGSKSVRSISGDRMAVSVEPGKSSSQSIIVSNPSAYRVSANLIGLEAYQNTDGSMGYRDISSSTGGKGSWLKFTPSSVQLNPGEAREIPFTVSPPKVEPSGTSLAAVALSIETVTAVGDTQGTPSYQKLTYLPIEIEVLGAAAPQLSVLGARPTQKGGLDYLEVFYRNTGQAPATGAGRFDIPEMGVSGTFDLEAVPARADRSQLIRWQPNQELNQRFGVALTITYGNGSTTSWSGRVGLGDSTPSAPPLDPTQTPNQLNRASDTAIDSNGNTGTNATPTPNTTAKPAAKKGFNWLWLLYALVFLLLLATAICVPLYFSTGRRKKREAKRRKRSRPASRSNSEGRPRSSGSSSGGQQRPRAPRPSSIGDENIDLVVLSIRQLVSELGKIRTDLDDTRSQVGAPPTGAPRAPDFVDRAQAGFDQSLRHSENFDASIARANQQFTAPPGFYPPQPAPQYYAPQPGPMYPPQYAPQNFAPQYPYPPQYAPQFGGPPPLVHEVDGPRRKAPVIQPVELENAFDYDHEKVLNARRDGHSWDAIANSLGTTPQYALMRFTNEENERSYAHAVEQETQTVAPTPITARNTADPSVAPRLGRDDPMPAQPIAAKAPVAPETPKVAPKIASDIPSFLQPAAAAAGPVVAPTPQPIAAQAPVAAPAPVATPTPQPQPQPIAAKAPESAFDQLEPQRTTTSPLRTPPTPEVAPTAMRPAAIATNTELSAFEQLARPEDANTFAPVEPAAAPREEEPAETRFAAKKTKPAKPKRTPKPKAEKAIVPEIVEPVPTTVIEEEETVTVRRRVTRTTGQAGVSEDVETIGPDPAFLDEATDQLDETKAKNARASLKVVRGKRDAS